MSLITFFFILGLAIVFALGGDLIVLLCFAPYVLMCKFFAWLIKRRLDDDAAVTIDRPGRPSDQE